MSRYSQFSHHMRGIKKQGLSDEETTLTLNNERVSNNLSTDSIYIVIRTIEHKKKTYCSDLTL